MFINQWLKIMLLLSLSASAAAADNKNHADQTFVYIKNILGQFDSTGRLVRNPGIDGSDLEEFVKVLREFESEFSKDFNSNSAMCRFYLDPENGRMTIEERAEITFSFLPSLPQRLLRYQAVATQFDERILQEFGRLVLEQIQTIKPQLTSHQRLPSSQFDEAAVINFLDAVCD